MRFPPLWRRPHGRRSLSTRKVRKPVQPQDLEALEPRVTLSSTPTIAAIARQVNVSDYKGYFVGLGVNQGAQRGYFNRQPQPGLIADRTFIVKSLADSLGPAGGSVSVQTFTSGGFPGENIIGVLPGQGPDKSQVILIGAHYDSAQTPGADDAASGVAGVLEAARVLGMHRFDKTIEFVLFDQEEQRSNGWGQGSKYFAKTAKNKGINIVGDVVLDQIGFNANGSNVVSIGAATVNPNPYTTGLENTLASAYQNYTNLTVATEDGINETDAYRLYRSGFPSLTVIEQLGPKNGQPLSPYFETAKDYYLDANGNPQMYDGRAYIDVNYATKMTRGTVAWSAIEAGVVS